MPKNRATMTIGVALHMSRLVATRLEAAWKVGLASETEETDADMARALVIAMTDQPAAQVAPQVDALTLCAVEFGGIRMSIEDAHRHPTLAGWLPERFAELLGECICSGRLAMDFDPRTPVFDRFDIHEQEGELTTAMVECLFRGHEGTQRARVFYGREPTGLYAKAYLVDGNAVYRVGNDMRGYAPEADAVPLADAAEAPAAEVALH